MLSVAWIALTAFEMEPHREYRLYRSALEELGENQGLITAKDFTNAAKNAEAAGDEESANLLAAQADKLSEANEIYYKTSERRQMERAATNLKTTLVVSAAPPLTMFLFGAGLLWAFRGFRG